MGPYEGLLTRVSLPLVKELSQIVFLRVLYKKNYILQIARMQGDLIIFSSSEQNRIQTETNRVSLRKRLKVESEHLVYEQ